MSSSLLLSAGPSMSCMSYSVALLAGGVEYTVASLLRVKNPPHQRVSWYDIKQSDGEASVMLELWGMWSTPSLPSLSGLPRPGVVAPDRVLSTGQRELNCMPMLN